MARTVIFIFAAWTRPSTPRSSGPLKTTGLSNSGGWAVTVPCSSASSIARSKAKALGKLTFCNASRLSFLASSTPRLVSPMVPLTVSSTMSFGALSCSSADADMVQTAAMRAMRRDRMGLRLGGLACGRHPRLRRPLGQGIERLRRVRGLAVQARPNRPLRQEHDHGKGDEIDYHPLLEFGLRRPHQVSGDVARIIVNRGLGAVGVLDRAVEQRRRHGDLMAREGDVVLHAGGELEPGGCRPIAGE